MQMAAAVKRFAVGAAGGFVRERVVCHRSGVAAAFALEKNRAFCFLTHRQTDAQLQATTKDLTR